jgi:aspartyl-tRNA(Asn)/glutamyl-tRNA(Gln) amidotransferase subunit A
MAGEVTQINNYLSTFPSTRKNFQDICASGRTQSFGDEQECLLHIKETADDDGKASRQAQMIFESNRQYINKIMTKHKLDALLVPITTQGIATYEAKSVNTWQLPLSSNSGLPALSINIGYTIKQPSMPVGFEIIGKFYDEVTLLQIAKVIEDKSPPRQQPLIKQKKTTTKPSPFSITQYNNLLTLIGYNTYLNFLKQNEAEDLSPDIFKKYLQKSSLNHNQG